MESLFWKILHFRDTVIIVIGSDALTPMIIVLVDNQYAHRDWMSKTGKRFIQIVIVFEERDNVLGPVLRQYVTCLHG